MTELNGATFAEAIQSPMPVAVDFWAEWCMPCKMFAPVLEQLSDEMSGKATICKLNVDEHSDLAAQYAVANIPTVIVFKNGDAVKRFVGARPKDEIKSALEELI